MKPLNVIGCLLGIFIFLSCTQTKKTKTVVVKNDQDFERSFETIALTKRFLQVDNLKDLAIKDKVTGKLLVSQSVDEDGDGTTDILLFQPKIPAYSEKHFEITILSEAERPQYETYCYSRFVPERTDDYAWENDRVAFRMFGPTAQKMVEDDVPGGTLSSGVDAWLKKVDYPIINSWYKKEIETEGTYHEDTGEGLDNFHVGISRGVGGVALKKDSTYYFSKNYTKWRTITTGPIRTSFYLDYAHWDAAGNPIKESKRISLDYGNNLSKFEISIEGTDEISAGLTLHEKDGAVSGNEKEGWISYWQPHGNSELGTGIVADPGSFLGYEKYDVEEKDLSNVYAHLKVDNAKVVYYAGFGWKERGRFKTEQEWADYLVLFSKKLHHPLEVRLVD